MRSASMNSDYCRSVSHCRSEKGRSTQRRPQPKEHVEPERIVTSETVIQSREKEHDRTDLREQSHRGQPTLPCRRNTVLSGSTRNWIRTARADFLKHQDYLDAVRERVCPLQSACGQSQAMSGVFSIASHSVLQYFPDVTLQEQMGWAHFLLSSDAIRVSFYLEQPKDWMRPRRQKAAN